MIANPSAEVDDSRSIPLMVFTADSILLVTSLSTSSGEAPGTRTLTATNGMSMFGQRSTVSREYDTRPKKTSPKISTEASTGLRTESSARRCIVRSSYGWLARGATSWLSVNPNCPSTMTTSPAARPDVISMSPPCRAPSATSRRMARSFCTTKRTGFPAVTRTACSGICSTPDRTATVMVQRADALARLHGPLGDRSGKGCRDGRVAQLDLRSGQRRLRQFALCLRSREPRLRGIELLLGDRAALGQFPHPPYANVRQVQCRFGL